MNPFVFAEEFLNKANEMSEAYKKIHANNLKYSLAFIAYNKAIQEMTEAMNENLELIKTLNPKI